MRARLFVGEEGLAAARVVIDHVAEVGDLERGVGADLARLGLHHVGDLARRCASSQSRRRSSHMRRPANPIASQAGWDGADAGDDLAQRSLGRRTATWLITDRPVGGLATSKVSAPGAPAVAGALCSRLRALFAAVGSMRSGT